MQQCYLLNVHHAKQRISMKDETVVIKNALGYFKNHWTKHRLVCTHFDAFSMYISNMDTTVNFSEIFEIFIKKASSWLESGVKTTPQHA